VRRLLLSFVAAAFDRVVAVDAKEEVRKLLDSEIFRATTFQPTVGLTPPRKQPSPHAKFRGRLILAEILGHALSKGFWFDQPLWVWRLGARAECHGGLFETKGQDVRQPVRHKSCASVNSLKLAGSRGVARAAASRGSVRQRAREAYAPAGPFGI
jgi:hypothetical protein